MPQSLRGNPTSGERYTLPYGIGDVQFLWILLGLEVAALYLLRVVFKSNHGG